MEIQLDNSQRAAVLSDADATLVLAGPGAGKTRVICHRIIHLIEEKGIDPGRIVAVTFTNRAADEMRRRLLDRSIDFEAVRVSTFHSFALDIVKRHHGATCFTRTPVVFDEETQDRLIRDILRRLGLSAELFPLRRLKNVVDFGKANLSFPLASNRFPPEFEEDLRDILINYQQSLIAHDALDFSDILLIALELLYDPEIRETERDAIDYMLIDEFQDINMSQYALILAVNPPTKPIFAVADEDQTIYNWRGSSSRFIGLFIVDYAPEVIHLEGNWRCAEPIIRAARTLIAHNRTRRPHEMLEPEATEEDEPLITIFHLNDEKEEHKLVLKLIENAMRACADLSGIAILGRTHYLMDDLHQELILNGVPVVRVSKESREHSAADLLSYFELTRSLNEWDIENTLRFPRRCLTSLDEIRILQEARLEGDKGLWAVLQRSTRDPRLGPLSRKRIAGLLDLIGNLPDAIAESGLSQAVHETIGRIAKRRSPIKAQARHGLMRAIDDIEFDPSLDMDGFREKMLQAGRLRIIFAPELMPLIASHLIAETSQTIFGANAELIPFTDDLAVDAGKYPIIAVGLSATQLNGIFPGMLIPNITCISQGKVHLPPAADEQVDFDYLLPLAAYALCFRLSAPRLPDDAIEIVFLDLETTSVDIRRAEIVEMAAVRYLLDRGRMRELNSFRTLVKPSRPIPPAATAVHGITDEMVADAPAVEDVIEQFIEFLGSALLAGHNIEAYDLPIIQRFAGQILLRDILNPTLDSLAISRRLLPGVSHTLGDLAGMLDVPLDEAHRALDDVRATAGITEILLHMEAMDTGLDFSTPALNLLTAGCIWDENAPDQPTELLAEASARAAHSSDAKLDGFDALAEEMNDEYRAQLGQVASFIRSRPIIEDEDDERFDAMQRHIESEAVTFTEKNPEAQIGDFLDYYALLTDDDCVGEEEAVRLMSLHSAKGLEFDTVIISGLEQGNLPHYLALGHSDRIEEERRLLYVGITRAARKVYLVSARRRQGIHRFPSMFLGELPEHLVKTLRTPKRQ